MNTKLTRRSFLKQSALAAGVVTAAPFNILHAANKGEKIRVVQIGCGGRAMEHLKNTLNENLVAIVDVDEKRPAAVLSLIHISEPTRLLSISYAVFCLKKKK